MLNKISVLALLAILTIASTAPRRMTRSPVPSWHIPCGMVPDVDTSPIADLDEEIKMTIESLKTIHEYTLTQYLESDYEFLYDDVRFGVELHQYIPNWVPGGEDVTVVKKLRNADLRTIANHLPKLHMDLQKFAVAFEELVQDETNNGKLTALKSTQDQLILMLCEVESNIVVLPPFRLPTRVKRSIMNEVERNPVDETRRLIRDWGVVAKYRDYLHAWRHVFKY